MNINKGKQICKAVVESKRISFIALSMDGTREVITANINPATAIYDIKRHIIDIYHNKETFKYNVALFILGCEDEVELWTDELMNTEIFVLVSAETARPLILSPCSFETNDMLKWTDKRDGVVSYFKVLGEQDRYFYKEGDVDEQGIAYSLGCNVGGRAYKTDDNGNHIVEWGAEGMEICLNITTDMNITCSRWSDDPAFNTE